MSKTNYKNHTHTKKNNFNLKKTDITILTVFVTYSDIMQSRK